MTSSKGVSTPGLGLHTESEGWWGRAGPAPIVANAGSFSWPSNLAQPWPRAGEQLLSRGMETTQRCLLRGQRCRTGSIWTSECSPAAADEHSLLSGVGLVGPHQHQNEWEDGGTDSSSSLLDAEEGWTLLARFYPILPGPLG